MFIGFGPRVHHDAASSVSLPDPLTPTVQNRQTPIGVGTVLGG